MIAGKEHDEDMKKWIALLLALVLAACCLPAWAAETGEPFQTETGYTLQLTRLGWQKAGSDCNVETLYQMDIAFPGESNFSQTVYFSRDGWFGMDGWNGEDDLNGGVVIEDINFDGFPDLAVTYFIGATNSAWTFFLWDAENQRFTADNGVWSWLSNYMLFPEKKIVYNHLHNSAAESVQQVFRWETDEEGQPRLRLIREVEIAGDPENTEVYYLIERVPDLEYGNLKESYRKAYSAAEIMNGTAVYDAATERLWAGL